MLQGNASAPDKHLIQPSNIWVACLQVGRSAPIVETRVLNDPEELERHLSLLHNGYPPTTTGDPVVAAADSPATNGHVAPYTNGDADALTRVSTRRSFLSSL